MIRFIRKTIDILLVAIIIILVGYFILRAMDKIEIFNIVTGSMEEKIHAGDYIIVTKNGDYKVGDVVTFSRDGYRITHRIVRDEGNYYVTKGDANNAEDDKIEKSSVIGKVIISGGVLNYIIKNKYIIASILLLMYLLFWLVDDYVFGTEDSNTSGSDINESEEANALKDMQKGLQENEISEEKVEESEEDKKALKDAEESLPEDKSIEEKLEKSEKDEMTFQEAVDQVSAESVKDNKKN